MNNRLESLDYLRGLMALSVMFYHYTMWLDINLVNSTGGLFLKLGIYGVSCFYVLSGISLALVYLHKDVSMRFIKDFSKKRFFRIAPLFYMTTTLTIILSFLINYFGGWAPFPSIKEILLNYTFLFSWFAPGSYIATGAWAIGNELVFYSLFPFILFLLHKGKHFLKILFGVSVVFTMIISIFILDRDSVLANQWTFYINPLNQLYFFIGGVIIGAYSRYHKGINKKYLITSIITILLIFALMPIKGSDHIFVVTGYEKIIFSLCIFGFCTSIAFWKNTEYDKSNRLLKYFGDTSYSIYLLHPIVFTIISTISNKIQFNTIVLFGMSVLFTLFFSSVSYYFIEIPFTKLARKKVIPKEQFSKRISY